MSLERIKTLAPYLKTEIKGQEMAIERVCDVMSIGEMGFTDSHKPKGSFLFIGPTGVGKSQLAKLVARHLYDDEHFYRFNMSEFKNPEALRDFIGDETGNPGRLGKILQSASHGILFFDEMEKAHRDVLMSWLQILDEAQITCGGKVYHLSQFYIITTSNIGGRDIMESQHLDEQSIYEHVMDKLREELPPEFGNRFQGNIIVFNSLKTEVQFEIARDIIDREVAKIRAKGFQIEVRGSDVYEFIVKSGIDEKNGARPLESTAQFHIRRAVARSVLAGGRGHGVLKATFTEISVEPA
ncbi:MAG: AAA family ATPase [Verrucomicrobiae bacterium]|nr:AAA family ATPase [Verrucomicrobiae bacterium]